MSEPPQPRTEAFMLPVGEGYRFCLVRRPSPNAPPRGGILYVHPFAEEMNKTRRAVAVTARRLAENGWSVFQIDLEGCGDSSGDIAQARWDRWQEDLLCAVTAMRLRGIPLTVLWGFRLGALLASSVLARIEPRPDLLVWQPVLGGKAHLTQFLRLKAAEELIAQSTDRGGTSRLRAELRAGSNVLVAGYTLNAALANAIDAAEFSLPPGYAGHVHWLETGHTDGSDLAPASAQRVSALAAAGHAITARAVAGPAFWQTVEIEECPALVEATVQLLAATRSAEVR